MLLINKIKWDSEFIKSFPTCWVKRTFNMIFKSVVIPAALGPVTIIFLANNIIFHWFIVS